MRVKSDARNVTCHHEAGHAIIACHLGCRVTSVRVDQNDHTGVAVILYPKTGNCLADAANRIYVRLAGWVAEGRLLECATWLRLSEDLDVAIDNALIVTGTDSRAKEMVGEVQCELEKFFRQPDAWDRVQCLAGALWVAGQLDEADVHRILKRKETHVAAVA